MKPLTAAVLALSLMAGPALAFNDGFTLQSLQFPNDKIASSTHESSVPTILTPNAPMPVLIGKGDS